MKAGEDKRKRFFSTQDFPVRITWKTYKHQTLKGLYDTRHECTLKVTVINVRPFRLPRIGGTRRRAMLDDF